MLATNPSGYEAEADTSRRCCDGDAVQNGWWTWGGTRASVLSVEEAGEQRDGEGLVHPGRFCTADDAGGVAGWLSLLGWLAGGAEVPLVRLLCLRLLSRLLCRDTRPRSCGSGGALATKSSWLSKAWLVRCVGTLYRLLPSMLRVDSNRFL